jgi:VanZ family protein
VTRLRSATPAGLLAWAAVIVWAAVIFALSATPNLRFAQTDTVDFIVRKAGHVAVFGMFAVLLWRAISLSRRRWAILLSFGLTVAYAASDEFHQSFIVGRHPSPVDVSIDATGALIALAALAIWLQYWARRTASAGST